MNTKTIFAVIGDAGDGKTTFSRLVTQNTGMLNDPFSAVIDSDEKQGLIKLSSSVILHPLRNREDFRGLESLMQKEKKTRFWIDTPGTSRVFIADAIRNPLMFARFGIHIVPVLVVGNRGSSLEVAKQWIDQMISLPAIYVVHNPKRAISDAEKAEFEATMSKMIGPTSKTPMHMPPLDADIAKEMERIGCPLDKIIDGKITPSQSELLSHISSILDVEAWKTSTDKEFGSFYDAVRAAASPAPTSVTEDSEAVPSISTNAITKATK
jgi:hypothetical protein